MKLKTNVLKILLVGDFGTSKGWENTVQNSKNAVTGKWCKLYKQCRELIRI